jgi:uncharacterized protein (TIGR02996 family)
MSDEAALLDVIRAQPDEDTPRLMYADWLQEHGQPERAEFIRLQVKSETGCTAEGGRRQDQLEELHRAAWTAHLPRDVRDAHEPWEWRFDRGLAEVLRCGRVRRTPPRTHHRYTHP